MRTVVQRVKEASVVVDGTCCGKINGGFLLLVGFKPGDDPGVCKKMAAKIAKLRIFEDEAGKMNLNLKAVGGAVLSISQFTLYADASSGNRPSFTGAARGEIAQPLYAFFNECLREEGLHVEEGIFGADMKVSLLNDGPVTILLDSETL